MSRCGGGCTSWVESQPPEIISPTTTCVGPSRSSRAVAAASLVAKSVVVVSMPAASARAATSAAVAGTNPSYNSPGSVSTNA